MNEWTESINQSINQSKKLLINDLINLLFLEYSVLSLPVCQHIKQIYK